MRKICLLLIITIFCFFSNYQNICAEVTGELVYDVVSFSSSGKILTVKGWALMQGYDNNPQIDIIAVSANDDNNYSNAVFASIQKNTNYDSQIYYIKCMKSGTACLPNHPETHTYSNVGFTATFNLDDLINKLGYGDITFKIRITNAGITTPYEYMAVYRDVASVNNVVGGYFVDISEISTTARIINDSARIRNEYGNYKNGSAFYWVTNNVHNIVKVNNAAVVGAGHGTFKGYVLEYGVPNGYYCSSNPIPSDGSRGYSTTSGSCQGIAYSPWVKVTGRVVLTIMKTSDCTASDNKNLSCSNGDYYNDCNYNIVGKKVTISYYSTDVDNGCKSSSSPDVEAKVFIKQEGDLYFNLDRGPIYSGGGFSFDVQYHNTAYWGYIGGSATNYNIYSGPDNIENHCPYVIAPSYCYISSCGKPAQACCVCSRDRIYYYSSDCDTSTEYENIIATEVTKKYVGLSNSRLSVTLPDSNDVNGPVNTTPGTWQCNNAKFSTDGLWHSGTSNSLISSCSYTLHDAYINKSTSDVAYGNHAGSSYLNGNDNNVPLYYIPLKFPTGNFFVNSTFSGLSTITGIQWGGTYYCDVACQQKLYDLANGGYLYYFRPISLSDPFPNGRDIGINWVDWISDAKNQERLLKTYTTNNNLEYTVNLTNTDISNIKQHNNNMNYNGGRGYLNYSIDNNGNSNFIKTYNYFTLNNVNHSGLGVFYAGDDTQ